MSVLSELVTLLALEPLGDDRFRGASQDLGWGAIFGGQVLGQGLSAAAQTAPAERDVHSLHAYFLRQGDARRPVDYEVERVRDGRSFSTRRVVARQSGEVILTMAASFHVREGGLDHQAAMPDAPPPEACRDDRDRYLAHPERLPPLLRQRLTAERALDLRIADEGPDDPFAPTPRPARRRVWLRAQGRLPDDPALHRYLLAYASDFAFLGTALLPHAKSWLTPGMRLASLDHAMWFHRPLRVDEWLLYVIDGPSACASRGLVRGELFAQDGALVASTAQEGLMRLST